MAAHQNFKQSGHCRITEATVSTHEIDCDKCDGTGKILADSVAELCRRWRESLDLSQWAVAGMAKITKSGISKFETGKPKNQKFKKQVIRALMIYDEFLQEKAWESNPDNPDNQVEN